MTDPRYVRDLLPRTPSEDDPHPGVRLPDGPDLVNRKIERDQNRVRLPIGEGHLCLSLHPGDEIGEIHVGVQYEGPKGQWDECMVGQNRVYSMVHDLVCKFLASEFPNQTWDLHVDIVPCEKANVKICVLNEVENVHISQHEVEHEHTVQFIKDKNGD